MGLADDTFREIAKGLPAQRENLKELDRIIAFTEGLAQLTDIQKEELRQQKTTRARLAAQIDSIERQLKRAGIAT